MKSWLQDNGKGTYSTHDEGKSVFADRFNLQIYDFNIKKCENRQIRRVTEYNNTYQRTIQMKPVDIKLGTYIDSNVEINDTDPKFEVADHVRI